MKLMAEEQLHETLNRIACVLRTRGINKEISERKRVTDVLTPLVPFFSMIANDEGFGVGARNPARRCIVNAKFEQRLSRGPWRVHSNEMEGVAVHVPQQLHFFGTLQREQYVRMRRSRLSRLQTPRNLACFVETDSSADDLRDRQHRQGFAASELVAKVIARIHLGVVARRAVL